MKVQNKSKIELSIDHKCSKTTVFDVTYISTAYLNVNSYIDKNYKFFNCFHCGIDFEIQPITK